MSEGLDRRLFHGGSRPTGNLEVLCVGLEPCNIRGNSTLAHCHLGDGWNVTNGGLDCSYIADVAVHPEFQGKGLGKAIIRKLVALSKGHKKIIL